MAGLCICLHIGLATTLARPICDKNHRLAMYQITVTMYYIHTFSYQNCYLSDQLKTKMASCCSILSNSDISQVTDIVSANNRHRFAVEFLGIDGNEYRTIEADAKFIHHDTLYECITRWKNRIEADRNNAKDELIRILRQIQVVHGWFPGDAMMFLTDVTGMSIPKDSK